MAVGIKIGTCFNATETKDPQARSEWQKYEYGMGIGWFCTQFGEHFREFGMIGKFEEILAAFFLRHFVPVRVRESVRLLLVQSLKVTRCLRLTLSDTRFRYCKRRNEY